MSRLHEIQLHAASVTSTKKVTRAMYLISASKSQKAKAQLAGTLPYFQQITSTMSEILAATGTLDTIYFGGGAASQNKGSLYLVLGSDKGMAGGYTHNIVAYLDDYADKAKDLLMVIGTQGRVVMAREGYRLESDFIYPIMNPSVNRAREIAEKVVEKYLTGEFKEVHMVFTEMISPIKQTPTMVKLLPLAPASFGADTVESTPSEYHIIKYEPSARDVFDYLVPHYLKGMIYSALVEAFTSEQHARMFAMDNATRSADDMISRLMLQYNRERQSQITQELTEVIGGIPND
ncbi:ATP synthase gamma chain [Clostridia bacterium]|nr:ATP synthase gamma chain [Clostridia bacterium]